MKRVVCNTKFKLDPFGDGGSKRSMQIRGLLAENGCVFEDDDFILPKNVPSLQLMRWALRAVRFIRLNYPKNRIKTISDYIRLVKYYALRIPVVYDRYVHQDVVFLWENTHDSDMLYLLKATGHAVFALPHNVESLVASHSVDALGREVSILQHSDSVFAISKEETWLLRLLGLNAFFLPYFPPKEAENQLLTIREKRKLRPTQLRKKFLLLGSASNLPTRNGMQMMIDYAASRSMSFDLGVVGYKTELLHIHQQSGITFYGAVTKEVLDEILEETDAVLIYQPPTTGALTRIPEMLVAGIPVFVNFDAGRNYMDLSDVILYDSFENLFDTLESFLPYQADCFHRDSLAERRFVDKINEALA